MAKKKVARKSAESIARRFVKKVAGKIGPGASVTITAGDKSATIEGTGKTVKRPAELAAESIDKFREQLVDDHDNAIEIGKFMALIAEQEESLKAAEAKEARIKDEHSEAKRIASDARYALQDTKQRLIDFLRPGPKKAYPLFDKMEPADEKKHGANAKVWRVEPISVLGLSPPTHKRLIAAEVNFVGQLQDRMQKDPQGWGKSVKLNEPQSLLVADKFTAYINAETVKPAK